MAHFENKDKKEKKTKGLETCEGKLAHMGTWMGMEKHDFSVWELSEGEKGREWLSLFFHLHPQEPAKLYHHAHKLFRIFRETWRA